MSTSQSTSQQSADNPLLTLPAGLSPDALDVIPVLSTILSRLQPPGAITAASPAAASPAHIASGTGPLSTKDIPAATDGLKHKLQKARAVVRELPDIERSVGEQEIEIAELQARIREQKEVLEGLRRVGEEAVKQRAEEEEGKMEG